MLKGLLADTLGVGVKTPTFILNSFCTQALQKAVWSTYVHHRSEGLAPIHQRKTGSYRIKIYRVGCYVVKEYTGDIDKVATEIAVLSQLHHDSLVSFLFIANQGARLSVVMEWAGYGLRELSALQRQQQEQQQQQQLNEETVKHIMYQLTSSLVHLHQKGIIHRDIKPDNIAVQPDFTVKLFDWSEAVMLEQLQLLSDKKLAKQVGVAGTPLFMPPEMLLYLTKPQAAEKNSSTISQQQHQPEVGNHAQLPCALQQQQNGQQQQQQLGSLRELTSSKLDIWGLGTVMFYLLSGRDILQDDDNYALEDMADLVNVSSGIKLPAGIRPSPSAQDFLHLCLERDPAKRATAKQLISHPWLAEAAAAAAARSLSGNSRSMPQKLVLPFSPMLSPAQSDEYTIAAVHEGEPVQSQPSTPQASI